MNDPGLDGEINKDATQVEHERSHSSHGADDNPDNLDKFQQAFLNPSRWWFASTAFPLIAGTFGPMASAFNICALVEHWRVSMPPGQTQAQGTTIPDPQWLIAINAVSLVFAIVANVALLMNMARRMSFVVAQPITIIGWYVAAFILVGLAIAATYDMPLNDGDKGIRVLTGVSLHGHCIHE